MAVVKQYHLKFFLQTAGMSEMSGLKVLFHAHMYVVDIIIGGQDCRIIIKVYVADIHMYAHSQDTDGSDWYNYTYMYTEGNIIGWHKRQVQGTE